MKKITLILAFLLSTTSYASDLIYKNGFENSALVSGTITGLTSSGLVLKLQSTGIDEDLNISSDGTFVFFTDIPIGETWSVSATQLPNTPQQQSCELNNETGVMPATGAHTLTVSCTQTAWNWDEMNWNEGGWN